MREKTPRGHVAPLPHYSWRSSQLPGDIMLTKCQYRCTTGIMGACIAESEWKCWAKLIHQTRTSIVIYIKTHLTVFCPERDCAKGRDSRDSQQASVRHSLLHMLGCQLDDLNQVEVSFKANPGHIRINVKRNWTHLDSFRACKGHGMIAPTLHLNYFFFVWPPSISPWSGNKTPGRYWLRWQHRAVVWCHSPRTPHGFCFWRHGGQALRRVWMGTVSVWLHVSGCSWGLGLNQKSSGFDGVWTLASARVLHPPTNSVQIFQVELNFRLWDSVQG